MARYAISPEGAAAMRSLASNLLKYANNILEASTRAEQEIAGVGDEIGIYESEILGLVSHNRSLLKADHDAILSLAQLIAQKADQIEELVSLTSPATGTASEGNHSGSAASGQSMAPTLHSPRNLSQTQYGFTTEADGSQVYDSPMEMDGYLYGTQGAAYSNIQGTCGLCSCANVLRLSGVNVDEKGAVDCAMSNGLCSFDKDDPDGSGGTNAYERQQILSHFGISSHLENVDVNGGVATEQTLSNIADNVSSGRGVIISVDAGHFYQDARYLGGGHALTVTSVKRSPQGDLMGFYICDSNQGTIYIDKNHLQRSLRASPINVTDSIIR